MQQVVNKIKTRGNTRLMITERGSMFGYQDLIVDFRGIFEMQQTGYPVVLDVTHSLQQPNQSTGVSGGRPDLIETLARAGIGTGVDGLFLETHPDPSRALSDGTNMLALDKLESLLRKLTLLRKAVNQLKSI